MCVCVCVILITARAWRSNNIAKAHGLGLKHRETRLFGWGRFVVDYLRLVLPVQDKLPHRGEESKIPSGTPSEISTNESHPAKSVCDSGSSVKK